MWRVSPCAGDKVTVETARAKHGRIHLCLGRHEQAQARTRGGLREFHGQPFRAAQRSRRSRAGDHGARAACSPGDGPRCLPRRAARPARAGTRRCGGQHAATANASVDEPTPAVEPLGTHHDRAACSCGKTSLDLRRPGHAVRIAGCCTQSVARRVTVPVSCPPSRGAARKRGPRTHLFTGTRPPAHAPERFHPFRRTCSPPACPSVHRCRPLRSLRKNDTPAPPVHGKPAWTISAV